jgi:hypothetical protein
VCNLQAAPNQMIPSGFPTLLTFQSETCPGLTVIPQGIVATTAGSVQLETQVVFPQDTAQVGFGLFLSQDSVEIGSATATGAVYNPTVLAVSQIVTAAPGDTFSVQVVQGTGQPLALYTAGQFSTSNYLVAIIAVSP